MDIKFLLESYRLLVLDDYLYDMKIGALRSNLARIVVPEAAQVLRQGNIKICRIVRVVDEPLFVNFGIPCSEPQEIS